MTRHHQLKNEARRAEQRSDWARAIELYKSAIRLEDERGSGADVGIYNRIGDLYLRQGDTAAAVEYYEQAADLYGDHGLHTSAIALCNKILRIAPDRSEVHGRLARLHAQTGLLAEARSAFLKFADRMRRDDRLSDALEAVQDLVSLTGDEELRTAFADQLVEAGLTAQAVAQLRLVYQVRVSGGRNAQQIRERILDLDPDADPIETISPPPVRATRTPEPPGIEPPDEAPETTPAVIPGSEGVEEAAEPVEPLDAGQEPDGEVESEEGVLPEAESERPTGPNAPSETVVVEPAIKEVIERFRSQVDGFVEDTDHAVHYDLGVTYMDMGLTEDAIDELNIAIRSPALEVSARALLDRCLQSVAESHEPLDPEPTAVPAGLILPLAEAKDAAATPTADVKEEGLPRVGTGNEIDVQDDVPSEAEGSDEEAELADMLFQARLAQHRVRAAADEGRADHDAHLDLGRTFEQMGLLTEAVREFAIAVDGPPAAREAALDGLEGTCTAEGIEASPLRDALSRLLEHDRRDAALAIGRSFLARPDVPEKDRLVVLELLPEAETREVEPQSHGPTSTVDANAVRHDVPGEPGEAGAERPVDGASVHSGRAASALEAQAPPDPEDEAMALMGEAEGLRAAGRMDEAEAHYYRALEQFEKRRDAVNAIHAVDRLLGLRPDDVVLHHQKNEFAIMLNDRGLLVSSYLDLAACLRRQNGFRSARTVYGRILDIDPGNAEARAGIAAVDADELARERRRRERTEAPREDSPGQADRREADEVQIIPAVIDELFEDLRAEEEPESAAEPPDYDSHYELGVAFQQMNMWEEAARELKIAVQGMADPVAGYELLGQSLLSLRRYDEARSTLSVAATQPGDERHKVGVIFLLGVAHLRSGDREAARSCFERVVRIDPSRTDAAQLLSTLPA